MKRLPTCAGGIVYNEFYEIAITNQAGTSWSLPKGHIEAGENLLEGAKREIYEETGLQLLNLVGKIGSYSRSSLDNFGNEDNSEFKTIHLFLFFSRKINLKPIDPHNLEAKWVSLEDLSSYLTHRKDKGYIKDNYEIILSKMKNVRINQA